MDTKKLKRDFIIKYIFIFFLYGHLFFLGISISVFAGIVLLLELAFPWKLSAVLCLIPFFICLNYYIRILSTTKFKWKFYKVYSYRLKTKPFDEDWFSDHMYEPCMRLIIRNMCYEYGYKDEYKTMYIKYAHENHFLEMKKQELIEQIKKRDQLLS